MPPPCVHFSNHKLIITLCSPLVKNHVLFNFHIIVKKLLYYIMQKYKKIYEL
jgi:hypothetical protein